jgi:hypothetical protein
MTLRFAEANPHFIARDAAQVTKVADAAAPGTRIAGEPKSWLLLARGGARRRHPVLEDESPKRPGPDERASRAERPQANPGTPP